MKTISDADNVDALREMSFVFMCLEGHGQRSSSSKSSKSSGLPFIDVGMGVYLSEGALGGILRVTTSTPAQRDHVRKRGVVLGRRRPQRIRDQYPDRRPERAERGAGGDQVEKAVGFYQDLDFEHHCTYTIGGNMLRNEDVPALPRARPWGASHETAGSARRTNSSNSSPT